MDDKDKKLIKYLVDHHHTSPFEHCLMTMRFKVPLFIRSQHHRHRTWSYNEISRRYTDENLEFYEPNEFRSQSKSNRQASNVNEMINPLIKVHSFEGGFQEASKVMKNHHQGCIELYEKLMEAGVSREQARGILPQNLYTEYYGTVNLSNLFKFIKLREHEGAQWEIVQVAKACKQIAAKLYPISLEAFGL